MYITSHCDNERENLWVALEADRQYYVENVSIVWSLDCVCECACMHAYGRFKVSPTTLITAKAGAFRGQPVTLPWKRAHHLGAAEKPNTLRSISFLNNGAVDTQNTETHTQRPQRDSEAPSISRS